MKILLGCSNGPDMGAGIAGYVRELSAQFARLAIEIHIASPMTRQSSWFSSKGFGHFPCDAMDDQRDSAVRLLKYVKEHHIEGIINSDNSALQSIAPAVKCPFISVGHFGSTSIAALATYQWRWCDYVVAISCDMQHRYIQKYKLPVTRCPVIHNGIRDRGHDGIFTRKDPSILRAIYAGGNNHFKGANILLQAVLTNHRIWNGVRLDWFGALPNSVQRQLADKQHVQIHGHVPHNKLMEHLRNADVLLFPSKAEGCPLLLLEAMSMGVVPIASDGEGAMRWLIESGQTGFICTLKNWGEQMMECISHLLENESKLLNMKRSTRDRFLSQFEVATTAEKILQLIQTPTVDRSNTPDYIDVLQWHRPSTPSLVNRLCFRLGLLRTAGAIKISSPD